MDTQIYTYDVPAVVIAKQQARIKALEDALSELRDATGELVAADAARATTLAQGMSRPAMIASVKAATILGDTC